MFDKYQLTVEELESERAVELPERDAMGSFNFSNWASISQVGVAFVSGNNIEKANVQAFNQQWAQIDQQNQFN
jgi:hypothetical protein